MIKEPEIKFSPWYHWSKRRALKTPIHQSWGGVYVFAHIEHNELSNVPSPWPDLPENIVYVGETKDLNMRPLSGHNRVARYRKVLNDAGCENLYICVCPIFRLNSPEEEQLRAFTLYVEGLIDWSYTKKFGKRPAMHFKEKNSESSP